MGNYLKMPDKRRVLALLELGWSYRRINKLVRIDLLVIEDFGMHRVPSTAAEDLLEIFTRRYETGGHPGFFESTHRKGPVPVLHGSRQDWVASRRLRFALLAPCCKRRR